MAIVRYTSSATYRVNKSSDLGLIAENSYHGPKLSYKTFIVLRDNILLYALQDPKTQYVYGTPFSGVTSFEVNFSDNTAGVSLNAYIYNDVLRGGSGEDRLDGGKGLDILIGGKGNDTYIVDGASDKVFESTGSAYGRDTIKSTVSIKLLANNIETLVLNGFANLSATGNALANSITGNHGANTIDGGSGSDILYGGAGKDTFLFKTAPKSSNLDLIKDFRPADDTIQVENAIFKALKAGKLDDDAFATIETAKDVVDTDARILYDKTHGALYYDPNGGSVSGRVAFAVLDNHAALTFKDFLIV